MVQTLNNQYKERFGKEPDNQRDLCYFLGDSGVYQSWSATSNRIPAFRRSNHAFTWFPHHRRWMMAVDKLTALGFPVSRQHAAQAGVHPIPVKDFRRASTLAGNFANVAVVELVGLMCFGKRY